MPKYDYNIDVSRFMESGPTSTYKGTVEAPDPRAACLVAFVHKRETALPCLPAILAWTGDAESYLQAADYVDGELLESYEETWAYDVGEMVEPTADSPVGCILLYNDHEYDVDIYQHDPDRGRKPQKMRLLLYLKVTQEGDRSWDELEEFVQNTVQRALEAHLEAQEGVVIEVDGVRA